MIGACPDDVKHSSSVRLTSVPVSGQGYVTSLSLGAKGWKQVEIMNDSHLTGWASSGSLQWWVRLAWEVPLASQGLRGKPLTWS